MMQTKRILRLRNLLPTALSAHLGPGARHFWDLRAFGYIFSCMFGHATFSTTPSMFAFHPLLCDMQWCSMVEWLTSVHKCNVLTHRSELSCEFEGSAEAKDWGCFTKTLLSFRNLARLVHDQSPGLEAKRFTSSTCIWIVNDIDLHPAKWSVNPKREQVRLARVDIMFLWFVMFISGDALCFCLCFCPARQHGLGNASAHQQMNWNRMKIIVSCIERLM